MRLSFVLNLLLLIVSTSLQQAWAQVAAPSNGGGISIEQITATTMSIKMGSNGNGQGRLVAVAVTPNGMPVSMHPQNNVFYTGSTIFGEGNAIGKGYTVYSGPSNTLTITGLQPNTSYYISNYEYNVDATSIAYNTVGTSTSISTRKAAPATPLPVELVTFTGSVNSKSLATLQWTTASEFNSSYFTLEYSFDGVAFNEVGRVAAAGNSYSSLTYKWLDNNPLRNTTYCRLKQIDNDNKINYSNTIILKPADALNKQLDVYPNPSSGQVIMLSVQGYEGEVLDIFLVNITGQVVLHQQLLPNTANYQVPFDLRNRLAAGSYLLNVSSGNTTTRKQLIIAE